MSSRFPYQYGYIDGRKIPYPIVTVHLSTIRGIRAYSFIMDSGADHMTMPKYMMVLLGLDKKHLKESQAQGIGKSLVKTWEGNLEISFCAKRFIVHCSFTDNDRTPLLLGKENIFDRFTVIFDNDHKVTLFQPL